jgi:hypothetical protein
MTYSNGDNGVNFYVEHIAYGADAGKWKIYHKAGGHSYQVIYLIKRLYDDG